MEEISKIINYNFKDENLLNLALTHSSYAHKFNTENNERLEFLGDSILGFVVAEYLMKEFNLKEGDLSKIRAKLVSTLNLSKIVTNKGLQTYIKTSPEELKNVEAVKADLFEALLGAIYLDSNLNECKKFIFEMLNINKKHIDNLRLDIQDYKTKLQEYVQAKRGTVLYKTIGEEGKPNNIVFEVELFVNNKSICKAKEKSKQKAENLCAKIACENLTNLFD